jgi:hypothetical protein
MICIILYIYVWGRIFELNEINPVVVQSGSLAKSEKIFTIGNLIIFIRKKMTQKGENYSANCRNIIFATERRRQPYSRNQGLIISEYMNLRKTLNAITLTKIKKTTPQKVILPCMEIKFGLTNGIK